MWMCSLTYGLIHHPYHVGGLRNRFDCGGVGCGRVCRAGGCRLGLVCLGGSGGASNNIPLLPTCGEGVNSKVPLPSCVLPWDLKPTMRIFNQMTKYYTKSCVVVKLLACGARGLGFESRSRRYDFRDWLSPDSKPWYDWNIGI